MAHVETERINCVGCTACATVCPKAAISMKQTADGFFSPTIDGSACIECGKCIKACPVYNLREPSLPAAQFAGWNNDETVRYNSTSGGMFAALAKQIISQGGIVFGAVYADDFKCVYHSSSDDVQLIALQKSKYAVSDLRDTFRRVLDCASAGRKVLFVGTPCQCAGLRQITGEHPNVIIVDFICGGTPSAKAFREYLEYKERKSGAKITSVDFRGKDTGWRKQYLRVCYANGREENTFYLYDPYFTLFCVEHLTTRQACTTCQFRKRHASDLTIADFWGYRNADIPMDDKGLSLVAVNTETGKMILDLIEEKTMYPLSFSQIQYAYEEFPGTEEMQARKERFMEDLRTRNFADIYSKYVKTDRLSVFMRRVASKLKR